MALLDYNFHCVASFIFFFLINNITEVYIALENEDTDKKEKKRKQKELMIWHASQNRK